jgi:2-polyprenyl-3-methyl-5-hydroxy-6-metoxy-1,4-benzoquinol methylase
MNNKTDKTISGNEKVKSVWSAKENTVDRYGKGFLWVESKPVLEEIHRRMSGNPNKDWVAYTMETYLNKKRGSYIGLSLGCGISVVERTLQKQRICKKLDAYDFAEGAIKETKRLAQAEKLQINYRKIDLNRSKLKKNTYDFIIANSVLHHIETWNSYLIKWIKRLLKTASYLPASMLGLRSFSTLKSKWSNQRHIKSFARGV